MVLVRLIDGSTEAEESKALLVAKKLSANLNRFMALIHFLTDSKLLEQRLKLRRDAKNSKFLRK